MSRRTPGSRRDDDVLAVLAVPNLGSAALLFTSRQTTSEIARTDLRQTSRVRLHAKGLTPSQNGRRVGTKPRVPLVIDDGIAINKTHAVWSQIGSSNSDRSQ